ncbi:hypothetical protein DM860_010155 [Cuscuta australis]|uniref:CTLH domain-containing protein n=1 Tax=Cuscuta australis TaxID=267555 RepID=A0A328DAM1_9ASTE|nr:hypothetical protein DM860_010155 [Cuscuta australis]
MRHLEKIVLDGDWQRAVKYISGFTSANENQLSKEIFFLIKKQKYLETLYRGDRGKALEILTNEFQVCSTSNDNVPRELMDLLTLKNFRDNEELANCANPQSARALVFLELKKLIQANPAFHDKLNFPAITRARLRTMVNQSLNWQHKVCRNPNPNPEIKTLFVDHICGQQNASHASSSVSSNPMMASTLPTVGRFPFPGCGWRADSHIKEHLPASSGLIALNATTSYPIVDAEPMQTMLKHSVIPNEGGHTYPLRPVATEIILPTHLCSLILPDGFSLAMVSRLMYTHIGDSILALGSNGVHKFWRWQSTETNLIAKATCRITSKVWQPCAGIEMRNDLSEARMEHAIACFALGKTGFFLLSASGGKVSLFSMNTFKKLSALFSCPPAATSLAFLPQDNNVVAIGMDDSSILIYNIRFDEIKCKLKGHQRSVTGLAFSNASNILVSSGADAQLFVWRLDGWEKQAYAVLQNCPRGGGAENLVTQTRIQLHCDQTRLLAFNETQISIYYVSNLERISQWTPQDSGLAITDATLSCDGHLLYACCNNSKICIFWLSAQGLIPRCRINPTAYLPHHSISQGVIPRVIAAHPSEANQFALGLSDGSVAVLEPLESDGKWLGHSYASRA